MLTRAVVGSMQARGEGTIINVAGMIAFSGPAPSSLMPRRAIYAGGLAFAVAMSRLPVRGIRAMESRSLRERSREDRAPPSDTST